MSCQPAARRAILCRVVCPKAGNPADTIRAAAAAALLCLAVSARAEEVPSVASGVAIARLEVLDGTVEMQVGRGWSRVDSGAAVRAGSRLRTREGSAARVAFPWMDLILSADALLGLPATPVLSAVLEQGRLEQRSAGSILKVQTKEAEVRGQGSVVVRRNDGKTQVTAVDGTFRVQGARDGVALATGEAAVVRHKSKVDGGTRTPEAPRELSPGADPVYVRKGQALALRWRGGSPAYHVDVLTHEGALLISRDVRAPALQIRLPYEGLYRWRVAAVDAQGVEGLPSTDGLFVVFEK